MEDILEVAPSGRAKCKSCGEKIDKESLRFGEAFVNSFSSSGGVAFRWNHLPCAAKRFPAKLEGAMSRWEAANPGHPVPDRAELDKVVAEAAKKSADAASAYPYADRAPTGRASCIVCSDTIEKGSVRIAVEREIDTGSFVRKGPGYLHPSCIDDHAEHEDFEPEGFIEALKENTRVVEGDELDAALGG